MKKEKKEAKYSPKYPISILERWWKFLFLNLFIFPRIKVQAYLQANLRERILQRTRGMHM